ncbi:hypothetical protein E5288_WYG000329 [Bos mutus]|nr:hypothetical protein [Bos mutus]
MAAYKLVLIRHGESTWNLENCFSGCNISKDHRYADITEDQLPSCESLKDTIARALPFWNEEIVPQIKEGKRVLIAAHGNSLRGIVKHLEGLSEEAIMELNLPTAIPMVYELDKNFKPIKPMQFLGDEETVRKAMEAVAAQGKAKKSQGQRMAGEQKPSSNLLEQFILLAKGTSGSALTALISQVLEAPGVYVFGELLELANVQELAEGANAAYLQLLNLFAYGTYPDYIANKESLPELSTAQQNKLKHLTIVSLASRMKCIPYSVLLKDLEMRNLRELEDLIIEAVYTDIIQGKLDQRNQLLEVDFCIGRDIRKKDINNIVKTLHEWCDGCEAVLLGIEQQVLRANQYKENHSRTQQQVEAEVTNIKKTLKATASSSAQEMEQQLAERECPPHAEQRQPTKKMSKVKGLVSSRH